MERPAVRFISHQPVLFRAPGEAAWRRGTAVNVSNSGFLFTTFDRPPEIGACLEVYFGPEAQGPSRRLAAAYVVRRVLNCWPDPSIQVAVQFVEPGEATASLAATDPGGSRNVQGGQK